MLRMRVGTSWALAPRPRAGRRVGVAKPQWRRVSDAHVAEFCKRIVALRVMRFAGLTEWPRPWPRDLRTRVMRYLPVLPPSQS